MVFPAVHGLVQFGNCGYEFFGWRNPEGSGPMLVHAGEEVDEPLAGDVVADDNEEEGEGLDDKANEVVHVRVSAQLSVFIGVGIGGCSNAPLALLQVTNAHGHDHLRPAAHNSTYTRVPESFRKFGIHFG